MKVLFVITGLSTGGAEMMLLKLMQHSPTLRQGRIVALRAGGEMAERFRALGVEVDALGMRPGVPNLVAFVRLIKLIRSYAPDVVSTWMYHADLFGGLAARFAGVPVVWGIHHSNLDRGGVGRLTRWVVRACAVLSRAVPAKIACCSFKARDVHAKAGYAFEKMVVIPNGFDLELFKPEVHMAKHVRLELGLPPAAQLVGLFGRYIAIKNHAGFIEAARLLSQVNSDVHFLLAGAGVDATNSELVAQIQQVGLADRVHLLGLRNDIPRITAALDVAVLTSWGEAFPNVLGEAMACGVPCVTTDVGDAAHIVGDTGVVVAAGDMQGVAEGMARLLALSPDERDVLRQRVRSRIAERFEISVVAARYEELFAEAVSSFNNKSSG